MYSLIKSLIVFITNLAFAGSLSTYGFIQFHDWCRDQALSKVSKGLTLLSKITEGLTCRKRDKNWNLVPIRTGHCEKVYKGYK